VEALVAVHAPAVLLRVVARYGCDLPRHTQWLSPCSSCEVHPCQHFVHRAVNHNTLQAPSFAAGGQRSSPIVYCSYLMLTQLGLHDLAYQAGGGGRSSGGGARAGRRDDAGPVFNMCSR
jgi:hypothetical protein